MRAKARLQRGANAFRVKPLLALFALDEGAVGVVWLPTHTIYHLWLWGRGLRLAGTQQ